jgi:hypothetical protein
MEVPTKALGSARVRARTHVLTLRRTYEKVSEKEGKMVSNYETTLRTLYEGYLSAVPLRLVLIVVVQRSKEECKVGESGEERGAVRAGSSSICSGLFCTEGLRDGQ